MRGNAHPGWSETAARESCCHGQPPGRAAGPHSGYMWRVPGRVLTCGGTHCSSPLLHSVGDASLSLIFLVHAFSSCLSHFKAFLRAAPGAEAVLQAGKSSAAVCRDVGGLGTAGWFWTRCSLASHTSCCVLPAALVPLRGLYKKTDHWGSGMIWDSLFQRSGEGGSLPPFSCCTQHEPSCLGLGCHCSQECSSRR